MRRVIWSGVNVARSADQGMLVVAQPLVEMRIGEGGQIEDTLAWG